MGPKFTKCLHILSDHKHIFASMYARDLNQCFCVFVSFTLVYALNGFSLCVHIAYKLWLSQFSTVASHSSTATAAAVSIFSSKHLRGAMSMSMCTLHSCTHILPEMYVQNKLFCWLSTVPDEVIDMAREKMLCNYTIYKNNAQSVGGVILFMCITFFHFAGARIEYN